MPSWIAEATGKRDGSTQSGAATWLGAAARVVGQGAKAVGKVAAPAVEYAGEKGVDAVNWMKGSGGEAGERAAQWLVGAAADAVVTAAVAGVGVAVGIGVGVAVRAPGVAVGTGAAVVGAGAATVGAAVDVAGFAIEHGPTLGRWGVRAGRSAWSGTRKHFGTGFSGAGSRTPVERPESYEMTLIGTQITANEATSFSVDVEPQLQEEIRSVVDRPAGGSRPQRGQQCNCSMPIARMAQACRIYCFG